MKRVLLKISSIFLLLLLLLGITLDSGCGPNVLTLVFTTSPQVLDAGIASNVMNVQIQDSKGRLARLKADTIISLTSTSATGRFDTNSSGLFNGSTTSIIIPEGSSSASFYYKDATAGTPTITVTELPGQGWNRGTQQETVNPSLTVTTTSLPDGIVGTYYSQNLGSSGGTGTYTWSISSGILPNGLIFGGNTISGTPTTSGTFNFIVQLGDGIGTIAQGISIRINENPPVTPLLSVSPSSLSFGSSTNQKSFVITNTGGGDLVWTITCNQPWLSVSPGNGSGNATVMASINRSALDSGNYSATITITSNGGIQNITVSVQVSK